MRREFPMTRTELEASLALVIDTESTTGIRWWLGKEMAPIAVRRWFSFSRRYKAKQPTYDAQVNDVAKGLQSYFEPNVSYTPFSEWVHLSCKLPEILIRQVETPA